MKMENITKNKLPMKLKDRLNIYTNQIISEFKDGLKYNNNFSTTIRIAYDEGISYGEFEILNKMRKKAILMSECSFIYNNKLCMYTNRQEDNYQLILELPIGLNKEYLRNIKYDYGYLGYFGEKLKWKQKPESILNYVIGTNTEGKIVIGAKDWYSHRDIVYDIYKITRKLKNVEGDRFKVTKQNKKLPKIDIYSTSQDFGMSDHTKVAEILKKEGFYAKNTEEN